MDSTLTSQKRAAPAHPAGAAARVDSYQGIHKTLRLMMSDTLTRIGAADPADAPQVQAALQQLGELLAVCEVHVEDENRFVHPALERAQPGSAARIAAEHVHHLESIEHLRELGRVVEAAHAPARAAALARLYSALALFVGENFVHMHAEETEHNPVLWAHYSDAELIAIEQEIVASIPPVTMELALRWFVPALNAPERAAMFGGMQQGLPPDAFRGLMAMARTRIAESEYAKLEGALSAAR